MALGLDWIAEFMDTYPVPVRFEHFAELRAFLVAQAASLSRETGRSVSVIVFEEIKVTHR